MKTPRSATIGSQSKKMWLACATAVHLAVKARAAAEFQIY